MSPKIWSLDYMMMTCSMEWCTFLQTVALRRSKFDAVDNQPPAATNAQLE
jgi:hypothetical protein